MIIMIGVSGGRQSNTPVLALRFKFDFPQYCLLLFYLGICYKALMNNKMSLVELVTFK